MRWLFKPLKKDLIFQQSRHFVSFHSQVFIDQGHFLQLEFFHLQGHFSVISKDPRQVIPRSCQVDYQILELQGMG